MPLAHRVILANHVTHFQPSSLAFGLSVLLCEMGRVYRKCACLTQSSSLWRGGFVNCQGQCQHARAALGWGSGSSFTTQRCRFLAVGIWTRSVSFSQLQVGCL